MAPKKLNAFMVFVMEWRSKNSPNIPIAKAVEHANPIWKRMSAEEKLQYKDEAKNSTQILNPKKGKLTCDGIPIEFIEKQQKEKYLQKELMIKTIDDTVQKALNSNELLNKKFYFVMVNYFVRIIHTDNYVPAEVAVIEFSLKDGVNRKYHTFVNPKIDFYGNVYEAKHHADSTHQLPLPPNALDSKDCIEIFEEITKFIYDKEHDNFPTLYTHEKYIQVVNSCLQFLLGENNATNYNLETYSIQQLFFTLKCATTKYGGSNEKPRNKFITDAILERDTFEYTSDIACNYHEEHDRSNYCALSQVIRWAYTFIDYMGKDVNLSFIPGKHMPSSFKAEIVMSSSQNKTIDPSVESISDAVSELSLNTNYDTCDDFMSVKSQPSSFQTVQSSQRNTANLILPQHGDTSFNPWKKHDTTQPPDSSFFSLDLKYSESNDASTSQVSRSYGRGVAILDHKEYPSLGSVTRARSQGRGSVPRNK